MNDKEKDIGKAVERVVSLARLRFSDDKLSEVVENAKQVLRFVGELGSVDVTNVKPTSHAVPFDVMLREDAVVDFSSTEDIMSQAPERSGELIKVPKVIDSE